MQIYSILISCVLFLVPALHDANDKSRCEVTILRAVPTGLHYSPMRFSFHGKEFAPLVKMIYHRGRVRSILTVKSEGYLEYPVAELKRDSSMMKENPFAAVFERWAELSWVDRDVSATDLVERSGDSMMYLRNDSLFIRCCK